MNSNTFQNNADEIISQSAQKIKSGIEYISIDKLHPHDKNPRRDVGDVTELADSIKQNGILQNLTVVPATGYWHGDYIVIIGHRRLAAAKQAGLAEVPCIVREMSEKEQISTMLLENMQRHDLTPYEEAQGMQMMLDLGETVESVAEKTGFSTSTIRRRTRLLTLDSEEFAKSAGRQITLGEYDRLFEVEDKKRRNELLKDIGTPNFNDKFERAKQQEKKDAERSAITSLLDTVAVPISEQENDMVYVKGVHNLKTAQEFVDEEKKDGDYFYIPSPYTIWIYRRPTDEEVQQRNAEKESKEKERQAKDAKRAELDALTAHYYKLRYNFVVNGGAGIKGNLPIITEMMLKGILRANYIRVDTSELLNMLGFEFEDTDSEEYDEDEVAEIYLQDMQEQHPERFALCVGYLTFEDSNRSGYHSYYDLKHTNNDKLDTLYEMLERLGYERSDEEKAYCDGTHELFRREQHEENAE